MTHTPISQPPGDQPLSDQHGHGHRIPKKLRWSRALIPGWVHWSSGSRFVGALGLLLFWLTLIGTIAAGVVVVLHPDVLAPLATNGQVLTQALVAVVFVGAVYLLFTAAAYAKLRRNQRFRVGKLGVVVLVMAFLAQNAAFAGASIAINRQRVFVNRVLVEPPTPQSPDPSASPEDPELQGQINVMMLGGDAGSNRWSMRPDSISVANIDLVSGRIVVMGIPRNLQKVPFSQGSPMRKKFPNGYNCGPRCMINAVYVYAMGHKGLYSGSKYKGKNPGIEATREAAEGVLGINIQYYAIIDLSGFVHLVDAVGGVSVCVPKEVHADNGTVIKTGCQHMDGRKTLLYARTRHDSSDYNRMIKQRLVQEALVRQVQGIKLLKAYNEISAHGSAYIQTDIPQDMATKLLKVAIRSANAPFKSLNLMPPLISTSHPDYNKIHALVRKTLAR